MGALKMSLVDNDYVTQAETNLSLNQDVMDKISSFLVRMKEELVTGQSAYLHIQGAEKDSIILEIAQSA
jgi:hypothetical protein